MSKGRILLGSFIGSIVGVGLLVLSFYLSNTLDKPFLSLAGIGGLAIGGFVAGLIATTPGKGALAGGLTAVVTFIVVAIIMVILVVGVAYGLVATIVGLASFGQVTPTTDPGATGLLIGIGLILAVIISGISAVINAITGFLGGLVNNPKKSVAEAYQDYPEVR
ncbi:MAG: hypothetical protein ACTSO7_14015 [Candidatus Heimdallarchaeota archaeon]